tara:strand:+ start:1837 stop:3024 length:1188 start_codon:yes stop_codon:yes gene_type:complete
MEAAVITERFYAELPSTSDFAAVAELEAYVPVPDDWSVLHSDVVDSTGAIASGRYKDVNLVGAAGITAVLNAAPGLAIPYVFGGDGASLLVPPTAVNAGRDALLALAGLAKTRFGLELRVAALALSEIRSRGSDIAVRKLELSPGNNLALFSGGGLELVDRLVKAPGADNPFRLDAANAEADPDLNGLSCRWEPLRASNGVSLVLMLRASSPEPSAQANVLRQSLATIQGILQADAQSAAPVRPETIRFRWPPRTLWAEAKATAGSRSPWRQYLSLLLETMFQGIAEVFQRKVGPYDPPAYANELRANTDFRKYDGLLRLVLDVTPQQADAIEAYLASNYQAGTLVYGTHRADSALMTCLVFSLEAGQHVHFIDGADGGFALAAQAFKARLTDNG